MKKLRIALIGLGDIAQKAYLPIVANHKDIQPILCTRNVSILMELKKKYRIDEVYTDIEELINSKPDAVMIHTSTTSHFSIAQKCLHAGIPTFVDKPLSFLFEECEALITLALTKNLPLYVGFNRRFSPLIVPLENKEAIHIRWQKNRVALPAIPREFIYNDFIHLVDGLRFLAQLAPTEIPNEINVNSFMKGDLLANVHIQFKHDNTLVEGSMNRLSGSTEEQLDLFLANEKYQIKGLVRGEHYQSGNVTQLGFNDWQSHLYTRGFEAMIEDWLIDVKLGTANIQRLQNILASHLMCEKIVKKIEATRVK
ncbi:MAG: Gfo/Idh/MocA family oxidoreductase [Colwellia sp.]|nr:Gfo/Idh/MocA family oxidoreductase [Colwellia sp.]